MSPAPEYAYAGLKVNGTCLDLPDGFFNKDVSIPEAWDYHAEHSPDHPLFIYEDEPGELKKVTWRQANLATHRAARMIQEFAATHGLHTVDPLNPPIVGLLANAGKTKQFCSLLCKS